MWPAALLHRLAGMVTLQSPLAEQPSRGWHLLLCPITSMLVRCTGVPQQDHGSTPPALLLQSTLGLHARTPPARPPCEASALLLQYTFILHASKALPKQVTDWEAGKSRQRKSVGVRMPDDVICQVTPCWWEACQCITGSPAAALESRCSCRASAFQNGACVSCGRTPGAGALL